jgi:hypothetical protein
MTMKISRDVVSDLWPVYEAGEASADTKALVEEFLAQDPAFAAALRGGMTLPKMEARMPGTTETHALKRTRDLVQGRGWLRGVRLFALAMTAVACGRLVEDTRFTELPARAIASGIVALVAWIVYVVALEAQRRRALR